MLKFLKPPDNWRVPVLILTGMLTGIGLYAFYISKAVSYLSDRSETCVNCHIMAPQYATWNHSSHREVTNCNDCHVPHNNVLNKYYFKSKDGLRHAAIFTLRNEPQVIFIEEAGQEVVQENCIRCHSNTLISHPVSILIPDYHSAILDRRCVDCHRETPHGRVNSLSSVPFARVPLSESPVPDWLKKNVP